MRRTNLLHGTAITLGTISALSCAASAQAATMQEATPVAPPMAGATPTENPAAPGIKSAAGADADIVVTARKRVERLIDVPISIQAFSREEIKASGIDDIQTLKDRAGFQAPQALSTGPGGRSIGILVFRGLQASAFGDPLRDSSGSLFIDGVYVSGGPQSVNTADVERIEVLKGPQNTYFGRSTFGGAVNFITRNPSDRFGGEVNLRATARGTVDGDFSVEGPLTQGINARLTAYTHNKVAQYHANDGGDLGAEESQGISATIYAKPADNLWFRLRGNYQRDNDSSPTITLLDGTTYAPGACTGRFFRGINERTGQPIAIQSPPRNYFCNGLPSLDSLGQQVITTTTHLPSNFISLVRGSVLATEPGPTNLTPATSRLGLGGFPGLSHSGLRRNAYRLSGQTGYEFEGGHSVGLSVGYNEQESTTFYDFDRSDRDENTRRVAGLGTTAYYTAYGTRSKDLSIDGRFQSNPANPLRILIGGNYYKGQFRIHQIDYRYPNQLDQSATGAPVRALYPNGYAYFSAFVNTEGKVPAVYGAIEYDLLKSLTLAAEGRYQWDKTISNPNPNIAGAPTLSATFKKFLPRVSAKFEPVRDLNFYVSYAKGVQQSNVNGGFANLSATLQAAVRAIPGYENAGVFSPQPQLEAYEIGAKGRLLDGRLSFSLAVYQNDWKDATTTAAVFNSPSCLATNTTNTPACPFPTGGTSVTTPNDARIRGFELEVNARPLPGLTLDLTVDHKDAKWLRYRNNAFNSFVFPFGTVPGDSFNGSGNNLARVPNWSGTFSSTYRGDLNADTRFYVRGDVLYTGRAWDSDLNLFRTNDYARVNARVGIERDNIVIEAFATNLLNDKNYDFAGITVGLGGTGFFVDRAALVQPAQRREFGLRTQFKF